MIGRRMLRKKKYIVAWKQSETVTRNDGPLSKKRMRRLTDALNRMQIPYYVISGE